MTENTASKKLSFEDRAKAAPTELHKAFAHWIEMETGYKPDLKTLQLVTTLRNEFQKSPENQASLAARKSEAAKKADEAKAKRLAKLETELAKLKGDEVEAPKEEAKPEEATEEPAPTATEEAAQDAAPVSETATEGSEEAKPVAKPRTRRTRRTTTTK